LVAQKSKHSQIKFQAEISLSSGKNEDTLENAEKRQEKLFLVSSFGQPITVFR
jgi:hypothetical protein